MILALALWVALGVADVRAETADTTPCTRRPDRTLELRARHPLPDVDFGWLGFSAHTQGLHVTDTHFTVTARVDGILRWPVLVRFARGSEDAPEVLDLSPFAPGLLRNHPGGFDSDDEGLWIPVSGSRSGSDTVVVRLRVAPGAPLADAVPTASFPVDDHIGALAFVRPLGVLLGASWDTQTVYEFDPRGSELRRTPRPRFVGASWAVAVQDWKGIGRGRILAGGIERSERAAGAVVDEIDVVHRTLCARWRVPEPSPGSGPATREGLDLHGDALYLLPADLNRGAEVLEYAFPAP